jgi:nitrogen regulatory protein PII-like uncharacterized protein
MTGKFVIEKSLLSTDKYDIILNDSEDIESVNSSIKNLSEKDLIDLIDTIIHFLES